jgi:glycosyltransferase involved in cell wall biosynthesis
LLAGGRAAKMAWMADRRRFTLCVITRDEEQNLARCLASARFADDVVVLDSGSTDRTVEVARAAGARVFVEPFRGHVAQKNRAVELAKHDWVLSLDADEELTPQLRESVERALATAGEADATGNGAARGLAAFELPRKTCYAGRFVLHSGWWPEWKVRLFDRRRARWGGEDPHDRVEVDGRVERLDGALHHYAYRDLGHHVEKVNRYTTTMARGMAERGVRSSAFAMVARPLGAFLRMYVLRRGFLDGTRGFVLATVGAFYVFLKYAKLWELTRALRDRVAPPSSGAPPLNPSA